MKRPLFSVIINNYNYACFLPQAIESALSQNADMELIIVDDGSTDASEEVLARYEARGCIVVRKPNGGQASAFNAGFACSKGEWIYYLDADDLLRPGALERASRVIRPGLAKIHFPLEVHREGEGATGELIEGRRLSRGNVVDQIAATGHHSWPPTSGNIFSRQCLEKILPVPEEEYRISADLYLNNHAPFMGEIEAVAEPLAIYRVHGRNLHYSGHRKAGEKIKQAHLKVRAADMMQRLLKDKGVQFDPGVFGGRQFSGARILARRFGPKESGGSTDSLMEIARNFSRSREHKNASFIKKSAWWFMLATYSLAPRTIVSGLISLQDHIWKIKKSTSSPVTGET